MWRGLTSITTLLTEISLLLREQNALTRELLAAMGRPSQTPTSVPVTSRPAPSRIRTDRDVIQVTRSMMLDQQLRAANPLPPAAAVEEPFFDQDPADKPPIAPPPAA